MVIGPCNLDFFSAISKTTIHIYLLACKQLLLFVVVFLFFLKCKPTPQLEAIIKDLCCMGYVSWVKFASCVYILNLPVLHTTEITGL